MKEAIRKPFRPLHIFDKRIVNYHPSLPTEQTWDIQILEISLHHLFSE